MRRAGVQALRGGFRATASSSTTKPLFSLSRHFAAAASQATRVRKGSTIFDKNKQFKGTDADIASCLRNTDSYTPIIFLARASWCPTCDTAQESLEQFAREHAASKKGDVLFVVGNVDENLALTRDLHINAVPHLSVWYQGKKRVDVHGPNSQQLMRALDTAYGFVAPPEDALDDSLEYALGRAEKFLARGKLSQAQAEFGRIKSVAAWSDRSSFRIWYGNLRVVLGRSKSFLNAGVTTVAQENVDGETTTASVDEVDAEGKADIKNPEKFAKNINNAAKKCSGDLSKLLAELPAQDEVIHNFTGTPVGDSDALCVVAHAQLLSEYLELGGQAYTEEALRQSLEDYRAYVASDSDQPDLAERAEEAELQHRRLALHRYFADDHEAAFDHALKYYGHSISKRAAKEPDAMLKAPKRDADPSQIFLTRMMIAVGPMAEQTIQARAEYVVVSFHFLFQFRCFYL